jgi:hypothetical protein
MPNITIALLEEFMNDLIASRSQVPTVEVPGDEQPLRGCCFNHFTHAIVL